MKLTGQLKKKKRNSILKNRKTISAHVIKAELREREFSRSLYRRSCREHKREVRSTKERERGGPEITQLYDVKAKLKREEKGEAEKGRREDEISLWSTPSSATASFVALLFSPLFLLTSFSSEHAVHNPFLSLLSYELSLYQDSTRTPAKCRWKCLSLSLFLSFSRFLSLSLSLRGCIHNGTGQNNSRDVFGAAWLGSFFDIKTDRLDDQRPA